MPAAPTQLRFCGGSLLRLHPGRGNVCGPMHRDVRASSLHRSFKCAIGTVVVVLGVAGCGRPATKADCDVILEKSAMIELEAQKVTDQAEVAKRIEAVRTAQGEQLLAKCVGRRVTDKAMACVRTAKTAEQVDRCLD